MSIAGLRQKLRELQASYAQLSESGHCDAPGGMEYRRVCAEWFLAGCPNDTDRFYHLAGECAPLGREHSELGGVA
jgi:hypothetical protein